MASSDTPPGYLISDSGLFVPSAAHFGPTATTSDNPVQAWLRGDDYALHRIAGVAVTPQGSHALAAYYACLNVLAQDCAKLPLPILKKSGSGRTKATDHPLWVLFQDEFNEDMTAYTGREVLTYHAAGWGNGYGYILRDRSMTRTEGTILGIYPIHPMQVSPERDRATGMLQYRVYASKDEVPEIIPADDMLHLKGLGSDGLTGYSVAHIGAESMGLSLAAQRFGAAFFGNGSRMSGVLEHPGQLSDKALQHLKESFVDQYGGPDNTGKPAIFEEGMKWTQLGIPPDEAQFLETRQFQVREICRWFRMQPHKIGDLADAHHTNIEQQNIEHVTDTMLPWFVRWEQEINRKLLKGTPFYVKHDARGLLRGDSQARSEYYQKMFMIGAYSPNQILEFEDMEPYEGGDERYLQIQYAPVRKIVDGTARQPRQASGRPLGPTDTTQAHLNGHRTLIEDHDYAR